MGKDQVETAGKKRDRANLRVEISSTQRRARGRMGEKGRRRRDDEDKWTVEERFPMGRCSI